MIRHLLIAAFAASIGTAASAGLIAQWDFNSQTLAPSFGAATLAPVGGTSGGTFAQAAGSSDPLQPGFGWQTSGYPSQGQASGTAGIEVVVNTLDYEDIVIHWDQRASNTASRWTQLLCSTDGGLTFAGLDTFEFGAGSTWFNNRTVNLSPVTAANHNASLVLRIVSIFAPGTSTYLAADGASTYGGGTWRFDMISIEGTPAVVPAPGAAALLGMSGMSGLVGSRRRRR